jgi:hypothetical protein
MSADELEGSPSPEELDDVRARRIAKRANRYFWYPLVTVGAVLSLLGLSSYLSVTNVADSTRSLIEDLSVSIAEQDSTFRAKTDSLDRLTGLIQQSQEAVDRVLLLQSDEWSRLRDRMTDETFGARLATKSASTTTSETQRVADYVSSELATLRTTRDDINTALQRMETRVGRLGDSLSTLITTSDARVCRTTLIRQKKELMPFPAWALAVSVGDMNPPDEVEGLSVSRRGEQLLYPADHEVGDSVATIGDEFMVFVQGVVSPDAMVLTICRAIYDDNG